MRELFDQTLGAAYARQMALADYLAERPFSLNLHEGLVRFGEDLSFPIQILGSEVFVNKSWMWAWANQPSVPAELAQASQNLKAFGEENDLPAFTQPKVGLDEFSAFELVMASSEILGGHPFYKVPTEHYALFFIILGIPPQALHRSPVLAASTLSQLIATFEVQHRYAAENFLELRGFRVAVTPSGLSAQHPDGTRLAVNLDGTGRIVNIDGGST